MNKIITYGLLIISSFSFAQELPSLVLKDLDGNDINLNTLVEGENIFVFSFWATWCVPCINELDAISEVYEDWQDETNVKLIAISIDDSRNTSKLKPFINSKGWEYEIYHDPNSDFKRALGVNQIPHTFLLNGKMEIFSEHVAYTDGQEDELYEKIKKMKK